MKSISLAIFAAVVLYACGDKTSSTVKMMDTATVTEHSPDEEKISLNNGQKWEVDQPMLAHIRNMEREVRSFGPASDHSVLSQALQQQVDSLTSSCTMKGQAHDELHKWLLPYIDLVDELSEADPAESHEVVARLRQSFTEFNLYFE